MGDLLKSSQESSINLADKVDKADKIDKVDLEVEESATLSEPATLSDSATSEAEKSGDAGTVNGASFSFSSEEDEQIFHAIKNQVQQICEKPSKSETSSDHSGNESDYTPKDRLQTYFLCIYTPFSPKKGRKAKKGCKRRQGVYI